MTIDNDTFKALCRQKLSVFTGKAVATLEPSIDYLHNWHIDCIAEHLQAVWDKEIKRLIINMPPRSLKTLSTSVAFPAWAFGQDPSVKFMLTSFKFDLACKMTRKTRELINSSWYKSLYPNIAIKQDQNQKQFFELTDQGHYYTSGMSSVTGEGCDIGICDDPLNPDEAASQVQRQNCIDTIRGTLFSRFNNPQTGRFILNMQRLNEDDPTGELLKDEGWYHLKLPAEAINRSYSYSIRGKEWRLEDGDLMFPERFSREVLDQKRRELGSYNYAGQYLQEPSPLDGGEFKKEFFNYFYIKDFDPKECNLYMLVDPAEGKEDAIKNDNDYTAMAVWALSPDQNMYLIDGLRERLNPTERVQKLFDLHRKWSGLTGKPIRVGYEGINPSSDQHYIKKKMNEENYRFPITELPPKGQKRLSKIEKIRRLVPDFENGRIWLPNDLMYKNEKGLPDNFISAMIEQEMLLFPFAPHDDFMDAMSMIYDMNMIFPKVRVASNERDYWGQEISVLDV